MTPETESSIARGAIQVLTIVTTVLASNFGVDYRATERTAAVHEEVTSVKDQNKEILDALGILLDKKLTATAEAGRVNRDLNLKILDSSEGNKDLNKEILDRLNELQDQIDVIKGKK